MRATEFLVEYNRQITVQNLGDRIIDQFRKEGPEAWALVGLDKSKSSIPEYRDLYKTALIEAFEKIDPTPHKEYTQWLCKTYAAGLGVVTKYEDFASRGSSALERFHKLKIKKQLKPEHKDINRFRSMQDFEQTVATYPEPQDVVADKGNVNVVYEDSTIRVLQPLDEAAAKYYGQGTTWCTAAKNNNMFERYAKKGPMYILLPLQSTHTGEKYQLHFQASQYMDESDTPITTEKWNSLLARAPQLISIFNQQATDVLCIPLMTQGPTLLKKWELLMDDICTNIAMNFPIERVMRSIRPNLISANVASPAHVTELLSAIRYQIEDDEYGLMDRFAELTPEALMDRDILFDEFMMGTMSDWVLAGSVGYVIDEANSEKPQLDDIGVIVEIVDPIITIVVELIKQHIKSYVAKMKIPS